MSQSEFCKGRLHNLMESDQKGVKMTWRCVRMLPSFPCWPNNSFPDIGQGLPVELLASIVSLFH